MVSRDGYSRTKGVVYSLINTGGDIVRVRGSQARLVTLSASLGGGDVLVVFMNRRCARVCSQLLCAATSSQPWKTPSSEKRF